MMVSLYRCVLLVEPADTRLYQIAFAHTPMKEKPKSENLLFYFVLLVVGRGPGRNAEDYLHEYAV